jgi:uncharacterized protein involved in high-affinity Fe2+ transport
MGSHHPAEYVAESIVNPNAVIVTGPGYTGADGLSIMPDYRHSLTVAELMDLVAYLTSLQGEHGHAADMAPHGDDRPPPPAVLREALVGNYRVRLVYLARKAGGHGHGSHASGTATAHADHHVMVVITNANTGESVPYLPVTMTLHGAPQPARPITLKPMLGDEGFQYGADLTVPAQTTTVALAIGATTMQVMSAAGQAYTTPQTVTFTWATPPPATPGVSTQPHEGHGHASEPIRRR